MFPGTKASLDLKLWFSLLPAAVAQPQREGLEDALDKAGQERCLEEDSEWESFPGFNVFLAKTRSLGCLVSGIGEIFFFFFTHVLACESS